ncbi:hypothetical protein GUJ93_ZPchr0002g25131 [Zizania palustris]|uniref:BED-type domain-containing protein n=1 Tax=Zizania palustris TaxID=103762 RepID=A0A8J5VHT5_ZIZPA|nr:hypothetical protein GUJ93_ZPchr0002g25131 [Zizania palustris]
MRRGRSLRRRPSLEAGAPAVRRWRTVQCIPARFTSSWAPCSPERPRRFSDASRPRQSSAGVLPKYFHSEWSIAQLRLHEGISHWGKNKELLALEEQIGDINTGLAKLVPFEARPKPKPGLVSSPPPQSPPPRRQHLPAAGASPPPTPPGRRPASPPPAHPFRSPHPRARSPPPARALPTAGAPRRRRLPAACRPASSVRFPAAPLLSPPPVLPVNRTRAPCHRRSLPPARHLPAAAASPPPPQPPRRRRRRRRLPAVMMVTGSDEDNVAGACAGAANAGQSNKDKGKGTMTAGRSTMTDTNVEVVCKNGRRVKLKNSIEYIWSHGEKYKVNGFSCYYCPTSIAGGGATRFRQHLAGVSGNVVPCENVPLNVKTLMIDQVANRRIRSKKNKDLQQFIQMEIMTGGHGHRSYGKTGIPPDEEAQIQMAMRESLAEYAFEKGTPPSLVKSRGCRNESAPILDEFIESDLETANPSTFIAQELEMDETEVAAFKKDTLQKRGKKRRLGFVEEDVEVEDVESDSAQGSHEYAEFDSNDSEGDGHDDDGGVGETHGDEECVDGGQTSGGGATNKHPTPLRPRSKRVKKLFVLLRD